jgi:hypothetical protein
MLVLRDRSPIEERSLEFDGLAIWVLVSAFAAVAAATFWLIASAAQTSGPATYLASAIVGSAMIGAWIFGYPRRAAMPAMSFVLACALAWLPLAFPMDGALLRDAAGTPPSRLYLVIGFYVGGLGLIVLAFAIFGFLMPLASAILALRRNIPGSRATVLLHAALCAGALLVLVVTRIVA